jgi:hypothetical protein
MPEHLNEITKTAAAVQRKQRATNARAYRQPGGRYRTTIVKNTRRE